MANPVPPLPDADRLTEYNPVTATVGPFDVGFALYGTGTDYGAWVEVRHDGELLTPVTDWWLTSPSGADLSVLARPLTDARITFTSARSGQIIIIGAQRPRRTSQATEGIGIPARDHNRVITELMAIAREHHEKLGRAIMVPVGEGPAEPLPALEDRAGHYAMFDPDDGSVVAGVATADVGNLQAASDAAVAANLAADRAEATAASIFETRAAAAAGAIGTRPSAQIIRHATGLPPSPSTWNNVGAAEPTHTEKIQTADGKWLALAEKNIDTDMMGASFGDASTPFTNAFNYLQSGLGFSLELRGTHTIGARLPVLTRSTHIWGHGAYNSALFRNYNEAVPYLGLITLSNDSGGGANGALVSDLVIRASAGTAGGCGISAFTDTTAAIGGVTINNVSISSDSTDAWYAAVYLSGNSATGAASGLRGLQMDQVQLFGGQAGCLVANGIKFANITNCQFNTAGGTSGKVILSGADDVFSSAFHISGSTFTDLIHLSKYDRGIIIGSSVQSIANADGNLVVVGTILGDVSCESGSVIVFGSVAGTVTGNVTVIATDKITMDALQVIGNRRTGWTAATGTAKRTTFNADNSPTISGGYSQIEVQALRADLIEARQIIKGIQDDLIAHGLIGS